MEVNGKNVLNARHDDVIQALQADPNYVKLVVSRLPSSPEVCLLERFTLERGCEVVLEKSLANMQAYIHMTV